MKRYAIVRVDGTCPIHTERLSSQEIDGMFNCSYDNCKNCRYGDTKEQLIRKMAQILKIETGNDGIFLSDGRNFQDSKSVLWEDVAKEIVEFLGVEE